MASGALEVATEKERTRRLVDRFGCDASDGGELAREQRAHQVSDMFRRGADESRLDGCENTSRNDRIRGSIQDLENHLDARYNEQMKLLLFEETEAEVAPAAETKGNSNNPLNNAFDQLSVQSILDFRAVASGTFAAEAVATAAVCAIANIDEQFQLNIHSVSPDCPWPDALDAMSEGTQFINLLSKFPDAVNENRVPNDNIIAARHFLDMANLEECTGAHPTFSSLAYWVHSAVCYWEEHNAGKANEELDTKAASVVKGPVAPPSHTRPKSAAASSHPRKGTGSGTVPPGAHKMPAKSRPAASPPTRSGTGGKAAPATSTTQKPKAEPAASARPKTGGTARQTSPRRAVPPSGVVRVKSPDRTVQANPKRTNAERPEKNGLPREQTEDRVNTAKNSGTVRHQPRPSGSTVVAARSSPQPNTLARMDLSNATKPPSVQEWRRMIEETKKEVREIRSMEAKMKWDLKRSELQRKADEAKATEDDIREWRAKDAEDMKAFVEEKERDFRNTVLMESKEFQEFKRERKALEREEDLRVIDEEYDKNIENAAWRADLMKAAMEKDKALLKERAEDLNEIKDIKNLQKLQDQAVVEEERQSEKITEMLRMERELAKEKERLLASLEFTRSCQNTAAGSKNRMHR